jgi:hypothetical protein
LAGLRRKASLDGVVVVEKNVDRPYKIECDDEQPKEPTYPYREEHQRGQQPGRVSEDLCLRLAGWFRLKGQYRVVE